MDIYKTAARTAYTKLGVIYNNAEKDVVDLIIEKFNQNNDKGVMHELSWQEMYAIIDYADLEFIMQFVKETRENLKKEDSESIAYFQSIMSRLLLRPEIDSEFIIENMNIFDLDIDVFSNSFLMAIMNSDTKVKLFLDGKLPTKLIEDYEASNEIQLFKDKNEMILNKETAVDLFKFNIATKFQFISETIFCHDEDTLYNLAPYIIICSVIYPSVYGIFFTIFTEKLYLRYWDLMKKLSNQETELEELFFRYDIDTGIAHLVSEMLRNANMFFPYEPIFKDLINGVNNIMSIENKYVYFSRESEAFSEYIFPFYENYVKYLDESKKEKAYVILYKTLTWNYKKNLIKDPLMISAILRYQGGYKENGLEKNIEKKNISYILKELYTGGAFVNQNEFFNYLDILNENLSLNKKLFIGKYDEMLFQPTDIIVDNILMSYKETITKKEFNTIVKFLSVFDVKISDSSLAKEILEKCAKLSVHIEKGLFLELLNKLNKQHKYSFYRLFWDSISYELCALSESDTYKTNLVRRIKDEFILNEILSQGVLQEFVSAAINEKFCDTKSLEVFKYILTNYYPDEKASILLLELL